MDSNYKVIITARGRQKLASALAAGTTVKLKEIALGDGNGKPVEPSDTQTALVREVYRGEMLSCAPLASAPENIVCVMAIPASVGGWSVREVGIFDTDGALFAVGNIAEAYKPAPSEGASREMLLRCVIGIGTTDAVELVTDPTQVIATQEYVKNAIDEMVHGIGELGDELREWAKLIGKYKYVVLTREEYNRLSNAGTVEEDVIYFVKGTQGLEEIREELLKAIEELRIVVTSLSTKQTSDVAELTEKISAISTALDKLTDKVAKLDPSLSDEVSTLQDEVERKIAEVQAKAEANSESIETLATSVNGIIAYVNGRLSGVETRLADNLTAIAEKAASEAVAAEAEDRTEADTILQGSVTRLSNTTTDHETRIKANEDAIALLTSGDSDWEHGLITSIAEVGTNLNTHKSTVASNTVLGHIRVGGNGVGVIGEVLNLNIRESYSGLQYQNKALYVNCAEQTLHPTAGTVAKVATDTAGMLVVPDATATSKGGVMIDKVNTDTGVLTNVVLVGATTGTRKRVLAGEVNGNGNAHGWRCTTAALGAGDGERIVPTEITFYRRNNDTASNSTVPRYMRILRASEDGTAWTIAYQSTNALAPNSFSEGEAMTWLLKNVDGRGAIPAGETILITQTDVATSIATANVRWGAKMAATTVGELVVAASIPSDPTATVATTALSPAADATFYVVSDLGATNAANISTLGTRVTALESRIKTVALTQAQYDALTTKDANTLYAITAA